MVFAQFDADGLHSFKPWLRSNQGFRLCLLLLAMFFDRHTWIIAFQPARFASTATAAETKARASLTLRPWLPGNWYFSCLAC